MDPRELVGGSCLNETWTKACSKGNQHAIEADGPMLDRKVLGAQSKLVAIVGLMGRNLDNRVSLKRKLG